MFLLSKYMHVDLESTTENLSSGHGHVRSVLTQVGHVSYQSMLLGKRNTLTSLNDLPLMYQKLEETKAFDLNLE